MKFRTRQLSTIKKANSSLLREILNVFKFIPLPFIALSIYMGLRSTAIYSADNTYSASLWHPAYLGWYDYLVIASIVLSYFVRGYKQERGIPLFIFLIIIFITMSFIANYYEAETASLVDAYTYLFRFAFLFTFGIWLVKRLEVKTVESFIVFLFFIIVGTSLFVYKSQYGSFHRLYASGMTVASFSQVTAIICLMAIHRNRFPIFLVSLLALIMTFSRTSSLLFLICVFILLYSSKEYPKKRK